MKRIMSGHDHERMMRAERHRATTFNTKEEELESLHDAIAGLQSTDDPSLVPLHDELMARLQELQNATKTE